MEWSREIRAFARPVRLQAFVLVVAGLLSACGGESGSESDGGANGASTKAGDSVTASVASEFDSPKDVARAITTGGDYQVVAVSNPGTIHGVVTLDSVPVAHDTTLSGDDASACGTRMRDESVVHYGRDLEGALVWVSDVHQGQALTSDRRADLAIVRCQFVPRMLALVQGTTINLQSKDATVHHTRFYSEAEGELLSRMLTVDRWAVVPSAKIAAQPGLVRVRLSRHPYVRGFVAVFDHPYFAVTNRYGRYRITGLPAGTYHVRVWHERADSVTEQTVTVKPGRTAELDAVLALH